MVEKHFEKIFAELGLELPGTAERMAKMYREEIFAGLVPDNFPKVSLFEAPSPMEITVRDIQFVSYCEHHLLPLFGKATISYIPNQFIMGLSTIHEIVHYFAKRPQLQERLTVQIAETLAKHLQTEELFVEIEAEHSCVRARGVKDTDSQMVTRFHVSKVAQHSRD